MNVSGVDLAVLGGYALAVVAFGLWMGRGAKGFADYVVGDRNVPWLVVLLSIVATETSTVTFLSVPGTSYARDLTWLQLPLGYVLGRLLVVWLLLPRYFEGRLFTAYEVLHRRFGGGVRRVASALFLVTRNVADGLRLLLTAKVLEIMTGLDLATSIAVLGAVTVVYTFAGGMRAVLWTDALQFVVYVGGAVAAAVVLCGGVSGGAAGVIDAADAAGKLRALDLSLDVSKPYTLLAGVVGGAFLTLGTHGADQLMVQRYLCAKSRAGASLALGLSGLVVLAQFALMLWIGVALWAHDQQAGTLIAEADRAFGTFIVHGLPRGLVGLLLGAVFATAMSTLSSSLNSSATAFVHDLWVPLRRPQATDPQMLAWTRTCTIVFAAVQVGVGIAARGLGGSVVDHVLGIAGFTTGIVLGVFFLGTCSRRVVQRDALVAMVVALAAMTAVKFTTPLAWTWHALLGAAITVAVGWLSAALGRRPA